MLSGLGVVLAITRADVADDMVKIGLSAAIGAVASYVMLRRSHRHEFDKAPFQRRQEISFKAAEDFEAIHAQVRDALLDYRVMLNNISITGGPGTP